MRRVGEPLEHRRGERRTCRGRRASRVRRPSPRRSRSARIASLRWSREVRSRISTPSRWSISCWMHARLEARGLDRRAPRRARPGARDAHVHRALDVDEDAGQAEAALLDDLLVLAAPLDARVDERVDRAVGLDAVDEHAVRACRPASRPGRCRARRPSAAPIRATSARSSSSKRSTGARRRAQHRVAELAHVRERGRAARARPRRSSGGSARPRRSLDRALRWPRLVRPSPRCRGDVLLRVDVDAEATRARCRLSAATASTAASTAATAARALGAP